MLCCIRNSCAGLKILRKDILISNPPLLRSYYKNPSFRRVADSVGHNRVSRIKPWKDRCLGRTKYPCRTLGSARLRSKRGTGEIERDWSKTLRQ
jgi:hypothetical protein